MRTDTAHTGGRWKRCLRSDAWAGSPLGQQVGADVATVKLGDEVIGFPDNRASHPDYVVVEAGNLTPRPAGVSWEQAGALFVAGPPRERPHRRPGEVVVRLT